MMGITRLQVYFPHTNSTTAVLLEIYILQYIILAVNSYLYQIRKKTFLSPQLTVVDSLTITRTLRCLTLYTPN
jgi:hypothetical protein